MVPLAPPIPTIRFYPCELLSPIIGIGHCQTGFTFMLCTYDDNNLHKAMVTLGIICDIRELWDNHCREYADSVGR